MSTRMKRRDLSCCVRVARHAMLVTIWFYHILAILRLWELIIMMIRLRVHHHVRAPGHVTVYVDVAEGRRKTPRLRPVTSFHAAMHSARVDQGHGRRHRHGVDGMACHCLTREHGGGAIIVIRPRCGTLGIEIRLCGARCKVVVHRHVHVVVFRLMSITCRWGSGRG